MNTTRGVNSENHILFCFISPTREILLVSSSCAPLPHHDNSTLYILHLEMLKDEVCLASAQNSAPSFNGLCSILKVSSCLSLTYSSSFPPLFNTSMSSTPRMMRLTTLLISI
ncbi:hypothetical protein AAZV13_18G158000 [Glycine max]